MAAVINLQGVAAVVDCVCSEIALGIAGDVIVLAEVELTS
jgi:hypothetical protein